MTTILFLLVVALVLYLLFKPRSTPEVTGQEHEHRDDDYSYLYYLDEQGKLQYEEEACHGCMELTAQELREKGYTITELVLGKKWSSDL